MAKKKAAEANANEGSTESNAKRDVFRMDGGGVINYGTDKDGKAYSAENSPKKSDATKDRWSKYRDGMTVDEALAAGLTRSNIRKDRRANFVTITNPEKAPAPAE